MMLAKFTSNLKYLAVLGVFALAACDESSNVTAGFTRGEIVKSTLVYANSKGPVLVEIHGDPFRMRDSVLADKVITALEGHFSAPPLRFTTDKDKAFTPNVSYRIAFGWPLKEGAEELCGKKIPDLSPNLEKIAVAGAFCMDNERLADAEGWVSGVKTPDDTKFKLLMSDLARSILDRDVE
jgi:hypothetical protein